MKESLKSLVCEYEGCDSDTAMTEVLYGHRLTLCKEHGKNIFGTLVRGYNEFLYWTRDSLKPEAYHRWRSRKREPSEVIG